MKYLVIAVLALVLGGLIGRAIWKEKPPQPVDPVQVIVTAQDPRDHRARTAAGDLVSRLPQRDRQDATDLHRLAGQIEL